MVKELSCFVDSVFNGGNMNLWFFQGSCMDLRVGLQRKLRTKELMLLNCGVGEDF